MSVYLRTIPMKESTFNWSSFAASMNRHGGAFMAVSYKKLFHLLIDKDISVADLQKQAGYSANISTRLRNNNYVSLESMEKICRVLDCKLDDVVEFVPGEKER